MRLPVRLETDQERHDRIYHRLLRCVENGGCWRCRWYQALPIRLGPLVALAAVCVWVMS